MVNYTVRIEAINEIHIKAEEDAHNDSRKD